MVVVMGEVKSEAYVDIQTTVRNTINRIGYNKAEYMFDGNSCGVMSALHEQSADINRGVERAEADDQGAGDQGMMFGYACRDTEDYMPLPLYLSHFLLKILADIRHQEPELMPYLRPDAKSQFTIEYDGDTHQPVKVHTIVLSTQHDEFVPESLGRMSYADAVREFGQAKVDFEMQAKIRYDVETIRRGDHPDPAPEGRPPGGDCAPHPQLHPSREPHREVCHRRPPRRHRPHRPQDHRRHLRRQGRPRRRRVLRQGPVQGGPQRGLRRPLHREEPRRRRRGGRVPPPAWRTSASSSSPTRSA